MYTFKITLKFSNKPIFNFLSLPAQLDFFYSCAIKFNTITLICNLTSPTYLFAYVINIITFVFDFLFKIKCRYILLFYINV